MRRALPTEFRFRDFLESDQLHGQQMQSRPSAALEAMRERRPEVFAADEVVFAERAPAATHDAPAPTGPAAQAIVVIESPVQDDFSFGFGGIAAPPSHDFPI